MFQIHFDARQNQVVENEKLHACLPQNLDFGIEHLVLIVQPLIRLLVITSFLEGSKFML